MRKKHKQIRQRYCQIRSHTHRHPQITRLRDKLFNAPSPTLCKLYKVKKHYINLDRVLMGLQLVKKAKRILLMVLVRPGLASRTSPSDFMILLTHQY